MVEKGGEVGGVEDGKNEEDAAVEKKVIFRGYPGFHNT